jgi:carbon monoxide dehydrogenase subunit G
VSDVAKDAAQGASHAISDPNNVAKLITGAATIQAKVNETFEDPQNATI